MPALFIWAYSRALFLKHSVSVMALESDPLLRPSLAIPLACPPLALDIDLTLHTALNDLSTPQSTWVW